MQKYVIEISNLLRYVQCAGRLIANSSYDRTQTLQRLPSARFKPRFSQPTQAFAPKAMTLPKLNLQYVLISVYLVCVAATFPGVAFATSIVFKLGCRIVYNCYIYNKLTILVFLHYIYFILPRIQNLMSNYIINLNKYDIIIYHNAVRRSEKNVQ